MDDYDRELRSVLGLIDPSLRIYAQSYNAYGVTIGAAIEGLLGTSGTLLYFPPGNYILELPRDRTEYTYFCSRGVQLFFATGALLRLDPGVTLLIEGTIRAGNQQIFGFNPHIRELVRQGGLPPYVLGANVTTWPTGRGAGRVIITSNDVPLVRPEWWGADTRDVDCSDAFEGAIAAACTGRQGLAPIPIVLGGTYACYRTLEVVAPTDSAGHPQPVSLVLQGETGVGGVSSIRRTFTPPRPPPPAVEVVLRLGPGVDFEFRDVSLKCADELDGCLDVLCSQAETVLRRGFMQRLTLLGGLEFQLQITETGHSPVPRHFVLDSCALHPAQFIPTHNALRLNVGPSVTLRVSNTGVAASQLRNDVRELPFQALEQANCLLVGGSVLLDSLMFHNAAGPRPSREPMDLDRPDGQDIFLGSPADAERPTTHLTAIQCESQGWWFLGRDSRVYKAHQAVLLGIAHAPVVWHLPGNHLRRSIWYEEWLLSHRGDSLKAEIGVTPSVVWRGKYGQCVLLGCRLSYSVVMTELDAVVDVGTVFSIFAFGDSRKLFLYPSQITGLATAYNRVDLIRAVTFDDNLPHLVPIREDMLPVTRS